MGGWLHTHTAQSESALNPLPCPLLLLSAEDVVYKALETVSYLASHQDNKDTLTGHPALVTALQSVRESHHDEEITALANYVLCQLDQVPPDTLPEQEQEQASQRQQAAPPPATTTRAATSPPRTEASSKVEKKGVVMLKSARTYMIRVQGLKGEQDKAEVERAVIRARGVISVSLDQLELGDLWTMRILAMRQLTLRSCHKTLFIPGSVSGFGVCFRV